MTEASGGFMNAPGPGRRRVIHTAIDVQVVDVNRCGGSGFSGVFIMKLEIVYLWQGISVWLLI